jgi:hypothetical protein
MMSLTQTFSSKQIVEHSTGENGSIDIGIQPITFSLTGDYKSTLVVNDTLAYGTHWVYNAQFTEAPKLRERVLADFANVKDKPSLLEQFWSDYGDHYISAATVGGIIYFKSNADIDTKLLNAGASFKVSEVGGLTAGGSSGNNKSTDVQMLHQSGGVDDASSMTAWAASVANKQSPVCFVAAIRPISDLFPSGELRDSCAKALVARESALAAIDNATTQIALKTSAKSKPYQLWRVK